MELYVYETQKGNVADFRPYLDGKDHSFDDHRDLELQDPRWEKINDLRHPVTRASIGGTLHFVGKAEIFWKELMIFPIAWRQEFDRVEWE